MVVWIVNCVYVLWFYELKKNKRDIEEMDHLLRLECSLFEELQEACVSTIL